jgi:hypothetical protein
MKCGALFTAKRGDEALCRCGGVDQGLDMILRLTTAAVAFWLPLGATGAEATTFGGYWGQDRTTEGNPATPVPRTPASRPNGQACRHHGDCNELNCRRHPDGNRYCAAFGRVCPAPGSDGAGVGRTTSSRGQCYECKLGRGWVACAP